MTINLLDISAYQGGIDATAIRNFDGTIVKVTEGTNYINPYWKAEALAAKALGHTVGLYHFARPGDSDAQADFFLAQTAAWWGKGYFPVLDWEDESILGFPDFAVDWIARVDAKTGTSAWLYTGEAGLAQSGGKFRNMPIWLPKYPHMNPQGLAPDAPREWAVANVPVAYSVVAWQFTSTCRVNGWAADLDASQFYGSKADLAEYAGTRSVTEVHGDPPMVFPVGESTRITQAFGQNGTQYNLASGGHTGTDYGVPQLTPVRATAAGTVTWAGPVSELPGDNSADGWASRYYLHKVFGGNVVVIEHDGYTSVYAHLSGFKVKAFDTVGAGDVVGLSGATGAATGPHLHFEILPTPYLWANGYYGRTNPVDFIHTHNATHSGGIDSEEAELATRIDELIDNVKHIRDKTDIVWGALFNEWSYTGAKGTNQPGLMKQLAAQAQTLKEVKEKVEIIWGGVFTDFSYTGKDGTTEPGIIKTLKALRKDVDALKAAQPEAGAAAITAAVQQAAAAGHLSVSSTIDPAQIEAAVTAALQTLTLTAQKETNA